MKHIRLPPMRPRSTPLADALDTLARTNIAEPCGLYDAGEICVIVARGELECVAARAYQSTRCAPLPADHLPLPCGCDTAEVCSCSCPPGIV